MSQGTPNPTADVVFGDGNSGVSTGPADNTVLFIGHATDGPYNKPRLVVSQNTALTFRHGALPAWASHHVQFGQNCWAQRATHTTPGSISAITDQIVGLPPGALAVSIQEFVTHAPVPGGAALNIRSGWQDPPSSLQMSIDSGANTVAHVQTVKYINAANDTVTEALSIPGPGSVLTTGQVKRVLLVTSNVDPVGTQEYSQTYDGPQDRYDFLWTWVTGGPLTGAYRKPRGTYSLDGGVTRSPYVDVDSTGIVDIYTYPSSGATPQSTGLRLTWSGGNTDVAEYGSLRIPGPDVNGDLVVTALAAVTFEIITNVGNANQPISFTVVGAAVKMGLRTDNAGNPTIATAAEYATFLANDAAAAAARALIRMRFVGTGATKLTAAFAATAFTNGTVLWKARVEGATLTVIEAGINSKRRLQAAGTAVTVWLDTDADGIRITTALQLAALVAGNTTASRLWSSTQAGAGTGLAGDIPLLVGQVSFTAGSTFRFTTTPPTMSNGDIQTALYELSQRRDVLDNIAGVVLCKDGADNSDFIALENFLQEESLKAHYPLFGHICGPYQGDTDPNTWVDAFVNSLPTRGTFVGVSGGEADTVIPLYSTQSRRNAGMLYMSRWMICDLSTFPSQPKCGTMNGVRYGLDGAGAHMAPGSDPNLPTFVTLWQSEDTLLQLHQQNIVTLRTWARMSGVYIRQSLIYTADNSSWTYGPIRRVGNVAASIAYLVTVRLVNAGLRYDPITGYLAEVEHQKIEDLVTESLQAALLDDGGKRHVNGLLVKSDRTVNYAKSDGLVRVNVQFAGKRPATKFETTIDAVATLSPNQSASQ